MAISTLPYVNLKPNNSKTVSDINQNTSCTGFGWDSPFSSQSSAVGGGSGRLCSAARFTVRAGQSGVAEPCKTSVT